MRDPRLYRLWDQTPGRRLRRAPPGATRSKSRGTRRPAASASRSAACPFARRDQIRRRWSKPLQRRRHTSLSGQLTRREPALRCTHRTYTTPVRDRGRLTAHAVAAGGRWRTGDVRCEIFFRTSVMVIANINFIDVKIRERKKYYLILVLFGCARKLVRTHSEKKNLA